MRGRLMPLSSLLVTVDTRERDLKRINAITTFFEKHGAIVEKSKLDLCDYQIEGEFRDKEINLGIEAKTLVDFSSSYQDLPHKLLKSYELFDRVGLIVETGTYGFSIGDDGLLCTIKNPAVQDGKADILTLPSFENALGSWANDGIIVRQVQHPAQWPYTMYNILIHLSKDVHNGLQLKEIDEYSIMLNMLIKIPGIGLETAKKLVKYFGNMHWMACMSCEDISRVIGKQKGEIICNLFHSDKLVEDSMSIRGMPKK